MSKLKTILAFHKNFGLAFTIKYINAYIYIYIYIYANFWEQKIFI